MKRVDLEQGIVLDITETIQLAGMGTGNEYRIGGQRQIEEQDKSCNGEAMETRLH